MSAPTWETSSERRYRKLLALVELHGIEDLAKRSGKSAEYLKQVIKGYKASFEKADGSSSERGLGDRVARAIEDAYQLGRGWFDNDEEHMLSPKEQVLVGAYRHLSEPTRAVLLQRVLELVEEQDAQAERARESLRVPVLAPGQSASREQPATKRK